MNLSVVAPDQDVSTKGEPTSFEEKLQRLQKRTRRLKNTVPKSIKGDNRLPSTYCLYVKANWEKSKEEYFANQEYYDNLYSDVKGRFNLMTAKILSARWKLLSDEEKNKYREEFQKLQEIQKAEKKATTPEWKLIKKPRPPFILFKMDIFASVKEQFPDLNVQQWNLISAELYKNLPEEKAAHYRNLSQKERVEYYRKKEEVLARTNPGQPKQPSSPNKISATPTMEDAEPLDYFDDDDTFTKQH